MNSEEGFEKRKLFTVHITCSNSNKNRVLLVNLDILKQKKNLINKGSSYFLLEQETFLINVIKTGQHKLFNRNIGRVKRIIGQVK